MKRILAGAMLSLVLLSSCHFFGGKRVIGDGNVVSQTRTADNFNSIDVSGAIDVYITEDSGYSVKVVTDNNLQELIDVYRDDEVLRIHTKDNFNIQSGSKTKVYVSAPAFKRLEASGACNIRSQTRITAAEKLDIGMSGACEVDLDVKAPEVSVDASGACTARIKGETKNFTVEGSGAITIRAFELMAETANIDISGAANAEVFASQKIDASASGSSDIRYKGNASINTSVSGAGSVKKVD